MEDKLIKIEFMPGCFDDFEGTQEQLDDFIAKMHELVNSPDFFAQATIVDFDTASDEVKEVIKTYQVQDMLPTRKNTLN
jgi:hypothetical protein